MNEKEKEKVEPPFEIGDIVDLPTRYRGRVYARSTEEPFEIWVKVHVPDASTVKKVEEDEPNH